MESNPDADTEEMQAQKKELEETAQPIISKIYAGSAPPPGGEADDEDAEHDEL